MTSKMKASEKQIEIAKRIVATKGKMFSVLFEKADGSLRSMIARTGVSKGVTGEGRTFSMEEKGLVGVYEMLRDGENKFKEGQYRCFKISRLISAKVGGEELTIE